MIIGPKSTTRKLLRLVLPLLIKFFIAKLLDILYNEKITGVLYGKSKRDYGS